MASSISEPALVAAIALMLVAPGAARAQSADPNEPVREAARAKLVEGVDALKRGEHQLALDRFGEAYALVPSPKIQYDFGLAYVGLGRRAEALSAFERFLAEAQDAPADKREKAEQNLAALRAQLGAVTIVARGAPDGTVIAVDGREVGRAPLPRAVYVDPGPHEIAVRPAGGRPGQVQWIEVRAGATVEVVVPAGGAGAALAGAGSPGGGSQLAPSAPSAGTPDGEAAAAGPPLLAAEPRADTRRIAALSVGAASLVLLAAGVTFGALAKREGDSVTHDSEAFKPPGERTVFDRSKESRGLTYQTLQVVGLVAGSVGLAAGIVLYATTRHRVRVEPGAAGSVAGASLQASF